MKNKSLLHKKKLTNKKHLSYINVNSTKSKKTVLINKHNKKYINKATLNYKGGSNIRANASGAIDLLNLDIILTSFETYINAKDNKEDNEKNCTKLFETYIANCKDKYKAEGIPNNMGGRNIQYNITLLCSMMRILFDYKDTVDIQIQGKVKSKDFNRVITCCNKFNKDTKDKNDTLLKYYMEDIYTDDLYLFLREYDKFIEDKENKSTFFFKSNLANISLLLKCHYTNCFDEYYKIINDEKDTKENIKKGLIDLLLCLIKAYRSYKYNDVKSLYMEYITFYYNTYNKFFSEKSTMKRTELTHEDIQPFFPSIKITNAEELLNYRRDKYDQFIKLDLYKILYEKIKKDLQESGNTYFIFLSCSHVAEHKQARFYMTKFIDGFISGEGVHNDNFIGTIEVVAHDFYMHGNIIRIKTQDIEAYNKINRYIYIKIYTTDTNIDKSVYKTALYIFQILQNEILKKELLDLTNQDRFISAFQCTHYDNSYGNFKKVMNILFPGFTDKYTISPSGMLGDNPKDVNLTDEFIDDFEILPDGTKTYKNRSAQISIVITKNKV